MHTMIDLQGTSEVHTGHSSLNILLGTLNIDITVKLKPSIYPFQLKCTCRLFVLIRNLRIVVVKIRKIVKVLGLLFWKKWRMAERVCGTESKLFRDWIKKKMTAHTKLSLPVFFFSIAISPNLSKRLLFLFFQMMRSYGPKYFSLTFHLVYDEIMMKIDNKKEKEMWGCFQATLGYCYEIQVAVK